MLIGPGRTEPIAKYDEAARDLVARGFAVQGLDWRGQGLSDRPIGHPQKGHVGDIAEYGRDLAAVLADLAAAGPPVRPLIVLAHSTGGLAALAYLLDRPDGGPAIDGLALSAPLLGLGGGRAIVAAVAAAARLAVRVGLSHRYVLGQGDWRRETFAGNRLTRDRRRFEAGQTLFAGYPALRVGGPTWGWLAAALDGCARLAAPGTAERIALPTLVAVAGADLVVDPAAARRVAARIAGAEMLDLPDSRHEILQEIDADRTRFLDAVDAFAGRLSAPAVD